eukprot:358664_1
MHMYRKGINAESQPQQSLHHTMSTSVELRTLHSDAQSYIDQYHNCIEKKDYVNATEYVRMLADNTTKMRDNAHHVKTKPDQFAEERENPPSKQQVIDRIENVSNQIQELREKRNVKANVEEGKDQIETDGRTTTISVELVPMRVRETSQNLYDEPRDVRFTFSETLQNHFRDTNAGNQFGGFLCDEDY